MRTRMVVLMSVLIVFVGAVSAWAALSDESNATLSGGASLGYSALATPNADPNMIGMAGGGTAATWSVNLTPGQRYKLTTRRMVLWNNNLYFGITFNNVFQIYDLAYDPAVPDTMQEWTALGYLLPTAESNTLKAHDGGPWMARIDWIKLEATSDIYFDENTAVAFAGNAQLFTFNPNGGWPANPMTLPIGGPNGFYFDGGAGAASITGNVTLAPGARYNVYASRQVISNDNLGYDVNINGQLFARCGSTAVDPSHVEFLEETLLGQYVATTALTEVQYASPGAWGSRPDYLRFEFVPEPGSMLALFGGLAGFAGLVIRRRK